MTKRSASEMNEDNGSVQTDVAAFLSDRAAVGNWVLDPAESRVEFHVKHFWGAITVHGSFGHLTGEGVVGSDGTVTGQLTMDAASLNTNVVKRDEHLRSAEFFDVEHHPDVVLTVTSAKATGQSTLTCRGTLSAAGHVEPIEFTAHVEDAGSQAVVLRAELTVDRTLFSMTWSPLGMTAKAARATVVARFVHS